MISTTPLQMGLNIRTIRIANKWSKSWLANTAHISRYMLNRIEGGFHCNTRSLQKICDALEMEWHVVAGYHLNND